MTQFLERLRNEPALVTTFLTALIALAVSFGLPLTDVQAGAIMAVVFAAQAMFVRAKVVPKRKLR